MPLSRFPEHPETRPFLLPLSHENPVADLRPLHSNAHILIGPESKFGGCLRAPQSARQRGRAHSPSLRAETRAASRVQIRDSGSTPAELPVPAVILLAALSASNPPILQKPLATLSDPKTRSL